MKQPTWDNPNKMHFESAYKLFNQQTNYIGDGNVYANTQTSNHIRPYMLTKCNHTDFKPGELMQYDLNIVFGSDNWKYSLPTHMREIIEDKNRQNSLILYKFFVYSRTRHCGRQRKIVGYVLTTTENELMGYHVPSYYSGDSTFMKRYDALMKAIPYVANVSGLLEWD